MGHNLPTPGPPDDAVIPLDPVLDVDIDHAYRPDTHVDGDLAVTYNLNVTGGTWENIGIEDTRRLTLTLDADINLSDGYQLSYAPRDSGTADPDNGHEARALTDRAVTSYEIDPHSSDHPDLVFDLPAHARTATTELDPQVKFTATDDTAGLPGPDDLHPRAGLLDLPTETFTVQLVTDEQADAAGGK